MTISRITTVTILLAVLAVAQSALAQDNEKKIKRSDLPPAVEKAVVEQSQGATVRGFSQEQEHGQTFLRSRVAGQPTQ